jgi:predicted Zn-dependent protease with MMP-like domain
MLIKTQEHNKNFQKSQTFTRPSRVPVLASFNFTETKFNPITGIYTSKETMNTKTDEELYKEAMESVTPEALTRMDNIIKQINDTKLNADELAAKAALSFLIKSFKTTIDERALLENERDEYRKALEAILNNWDEHLRHHPDLEKNKRPWYDCYPDHSQQRRD